MKKVFILLMTIPFCAVASLAQQIKYEPSLEKAKEAARQQAKPLAILITIRPPVSTPGFMRGLDDKTVIEKFWPQSLPTMILTLIYCIN